MANSTEDRRTIRIRRVREITGLCNSEVYRKTADPNDPFPAAIELGPHSIGWYEDEVVAWRDDRPRVVEKIIHNPNISDGDENKN